MRLLILCFAILIAFAMPSTTMAEDAVSPPPIDCNTDIVDALIHTTMSPQYHTWMVREIGGLRVGISATGTSGADAYYSAKDDCVVIPQEIADRVFELAALYNDAWRQMRAIRAKTPGKVSAELGFQIRVARREVVIISALLAHEAFHVQQYRSGYLESVSDSLAQEDSPEDYTRKYVQLVELPAYQEQERFQQSLQVVPRNKWMTRTGGAKWIAEDEALANILSARGESMMQFMQLNDQEGLENLPGFRFPGFRFPGFRFPGFRFPGELSDEL